MNWELLYTRIDKISFQEKDATIAAIAKHFCVFAIKSELDQILCGLSSTLGVLEFFRNNPTAMRPLLVCSSTKYSADSMYDAFNIYFSPDGSNKKTIEEATVMLWVHLLQAIEHKTNIILKLSYTVTNFTGGKGVVEIQQEKFEIIISDIMIFITGVPSEPSLGFDHKPCLKFCESRFPRANTCTNTLFLPTDLKTSEDFVYNMCFAILNVGGYGKV